MFENLITSRGVAGFEVDYPNFGTGQTGGIGRLAEYLAQLAAVESARDNLEAILLVADNDEDPDRSFRNIRKIVQRANKKMPLLVSDPKPYGVPTAPLVPAFSAGAPTLVVMMLPWIGERGALETLCLKAVYAKWRKVWAAMEPDLDQYVNVSPSQAWGVTKRSKMRMQCSIAATCEKDPNTPLAQLFKRPKKYHFSTKHKSFNQVSKFLKNFGALVGGAPP